MPLETPPSPALNRQSPWSVWPFAVIALGAAALALWQFQSGAAPTRSPFDPPVPPTGKTIVLAVRAAADQAEKEYEPLPWTPGMTVKEVMEAAEARDGLQFAFQGEGPTAFVVELDGLKNRGGEADAKNWLYFIDGQGGHKSFALQTVEPGARILWKFTTFD